MSFEHFRPSSPPHEEKVFFSSFVPFPSAALWQQTDDNALAEKAAQGVDVRVMYDDLGSISTYSKENVKTLQKRGIRCIAFNPLTSTKGTLNYRDHRKMLVIDGKAAFSGGVNLADEYINHVEKFGHWKDIGFRLTGPGVANYTRMFVEFWNAFSNAPIPDELLSQATDYAWFFTPYLMLGDALLEAFVHAKGCVVDGIVGTVGTVNLDYRSLFLHFENNSLFYRPFR